MSIDPLAERAYLTPVSDTNARRAKLAAMIALVSGVGAAGFFLAIRIIFRLTEFEANEGHAPGWVDLGFVICGAIALISAAAALVFGIRHDRLVKRAAADAEIRSRR